MLEMDVPRSQPRQALQNNLTDPVPQLAAISTLSQPRRHVRVKQKSATFDEAPDVGAPRLVSACTEPLRAWTRNVALPTATTRRRAAGE